jgi:hypothetical protein
MGLLADTIWWHGGVSWEVGGSPFSHGGHLINEGDGDSLRNWRHVQHVYRLQGMAKHLLSID